VEAAVEDVTLHLMFETRTWMCTLIYRGMFGWRMTGAMRTTLHEGSCRSEDVKPRRCDRLMIPTVVVFTAAAIAP
jgi:hypothetical protein